MVVGQSISWSASCFKIGKLPIQIVVGARYWVDSPDGGPEDWRARVQLTSCVPEERIEL